MGTLLSADEFLAAAATEEGRLELVRGEVRTAPLGGARIGVVASDLRSPLGAHARARQLGRC